MAVKRTKLIEDLNLEFPNLNQDFYGRKCRYCYMAYRSRTTSSVPNYTLETDNQFFTGFLKFDMQEDKIVKMISFGDTHTGGEVYYQ